MARDYTLEQFARRLVKYGMKPEFAGYVNVGHGCCVYRFNAGPRRREQLRYLIREQRRVNERARQEGKQKAGNS